MPDLSMVFALNSSSWFGFLEFFILDNFLDSDIELGQDVTSLAWWVSINTLLTKLVLSWSLVSSKDFLLSIDGGGGGGGGGEEEEEEEEEEEGFDPIFESWHRLPFLSWILLDWKTIKLNIWASPKKKFLEKNNYNFS